MRLCSTLTNLVISWWYILLDPQKPSSRPVVEMTMGMMEVFTTCLLGLPYYLQLILCDGPSRMLVTNILYNVVPSLEMPAGLGQDHKESLNQPDQSPLVPPHGAHLVQPSGLQASWWRIDWIFLTKLLPFSGIRCACVLWIQMEDLWVQCETISYGLPRADIYFTAQILSLPSKVFLALEVMPWFWLVCSFRNSIAYNASSSSVSNLQPGFRHVNLLGAMAKSLVSN